MIITSIERNKRNSDRLSVYIDNQYCFSISEEDYIKLNLYEKGEISEIEIEHIKNNINFSSAKSIALRYILHKRRSEKEVCARLESAGFDKEIIEKAVEELKSSGYINDKIYVEKYVFDRNKLKPKAKKMLKIELKNKGIENDIIDSVLSGWEVDETALAGSLIEKKFGKYDLNDEKVKKKVYSFLYNRGFSLDVINEAINAAKS